MFRARPISYALFQGERGVVRFREEDVVGRHPSSQRVEIGDLRRQWGVVWKRRTGTSVRRDSGGGDRFLVPGRWEGGSGAEMAQKDTGAGG